MASEQGPANPVSSRIERCYRHPDVVTGVHCTRCGRPICPDCMIEAPVGYQCPECVKEARRAYRQGPGRRARARSFAATSAVALLMATIVARSSATADVAANERARARRPGPWR